MFVFRLKDASFIMELLAYIILFQPLELTKPRTLHIS